MVGLWRLTVAEFLRRLFQAKITLEDHVEILDSCLRKEKAKHADELASLKCTFDLVEADLAERDHQLQAAKCRIADLESAAASTDDENIRIKARVAEAVALLQS
jgi:septal ring factor EnvC (AmiA/AmiB activator)